MVAVEKAFPPCKARVLATDTNDPGNLFTVTHASKGRVHLSAKGDGIAQALPTKGEAVYVESLLPQAVFRMPGRVAECMRSDTVTLIVEQTGNIERLQRRQYFRLETALPIELTVQLAGKTIHLNIKTQDISAGGFSLLLPAPIPLDHEVEAILHFPDRESPIACRAVVRRNRRVTPTSYDHGFQFVNMKDKDVDELITLIMGIARNSMGL